MRKKIYLHISYFACFKYRIYFLKFRMQIVLNINMNLLQYVQNKMHHQYYSNMVYINDLNSKYTKKDPDISQLNQSIPIKFIVFKYM